MNDKHGVQAATIVKGTWVEVERMFPKAEEHHARLAVAGAKPPQAMRVSGFLEEDADLGQQVQIRTILGSIHTGRLRIQNPGYGHSFCHTMPELSRS